MKKKNWFKPKPYTHITKKLTIDDGPWISAYVKDAHKIKNHQFYPLLHRTIWVKRLKESARDEHGEAIKKHYSIKDGKRESTRKPREIYHTNHLDAHIYSYYTQKILEPKYELELKKDPELDKSVIAYRRIEVADKSRCKCNIDFANEVFDEISQLPGEISVLALDISKFFDSLDHRILKQCWVKLLGRDDLPDDHYNVYKSLTNFVYAEVKEVIKELGFKHANELVENDEPYLVKNGAEFRERIKNKGLLKTNPFRRTKEDGSKIVKGIPQGTPMSAFLANLYMLEFDKEVIALLKIHNGIYRRYSDDILVVCPTSDYRQIELAIYDLIKKQFLLIIQESKTQRIFFKHGKLLKQEGNKPVVYLGFQYDGNRKLLKSASISQFYRKMKKAVRYRANRARRAVKKSKRGIDVNTNIFRKELYQQYSFLGASATNKKKSNYISYVNYASEIMKSPIIKRQLSKAWSILHSEINRYEKKWGIPKATPRAIPEPSKK